jgi:hypothetical protein
VGQVTGLIHDEPTVKEVVERIVADAKQVQGKLASQLGRKQGGQQEIGGKLGASA